MLRNKVFSGLERSNQPHFLEPEPKPNPEKVPPLFNSTKAERGEEAGDEKFKLAKVGS